MYACYSGDQDFVKEVLKSAALLIAQTKVSYGSVAGREIKIEH